MNRSTLLRHASGGAMAAALLWTAACAGPGGGTAGPATGTAAIGARPAAIGAQPAAIGAAFDPYNWGTVEFSVKWPESARTVSYIHPDTNSILIQGFKADGTPLFNSEGSQIQGALDRFNTKLALTSIPSGSARFDAVARNMAGTILATGSVTVQVEGATSTKAKLVLGLPGDPVIASFSPGSGIPGYTAVDIFGSNLDTTVPGFSIERVAALGIATTSVSARTAQQVTFTVPAGAVNGPIRYSWTASGVTRTATSSGTFRVIKSVTVSGSDSITVTKGNTVEFTATAKDTDDATVADAQIPWTLSNQNCTACPGTFAFVGVLSAITGATNSFAAQNAGTITINAGAGPAVATVGITVVP